MLDTATKKRIDDCRDILVGKLPDPKAQIEQITIALIYKFMDDMDREAIELGGKVKFFADYKIHDPESPDDRKKDKTIDFNKYAWDRLFDAKVTATEMLRLYSEAIEGMEKNPNIPGLFRDIFKNAYLPYRDPETLKLFLKTISEFHYTHSEMLGDAFEYLLSVMGSQGDAGQFRTPRHIIDFLVAVVDPGKNDTVLDPACGTAGFLISAFKHIMENGRKGGDDGNGRSDRRDKACLVSTINPGEPNESYKTNEPDKPDQIGDQDDTFQTPISTGLSVVPVKSVTPITPDEQKKIIKNFVGYDISPDMVRLSLVNLYLHGFSEPHIWEYDALSSEERWDENYDVILANPPFMSPKGGIRPHKKFTISSNRSEVLFVDYIAEHLNPKGRAGIIVPEGVIFQSGTAYKALRKMLVENYLYAVVSLPAGVFNPYSGVKTSILLMDKELAKRNKDILFVKIDNDGYGLGAQRNAVKGGQLEEAVELIQQFKEGKFVESEMVHAVEKKEIGKNGDYNLSGERYKIEQDLSSVKYKIIQIGHVFKTSSGGTPLKSKTEYYKDAKIPWLRSGEVAQGYIFYSELFISDEGFKNSSAKLFPIDTILVAMYGATAGQVGILKFEATTNQAICGILPNEKAIPEYLYLIIKSQKDYLISLSGGGAQPNISQKIINELQIPLPPLPIQEAIVGEIEGYQKIIDGAKMVVDNYKPHIDIDPDWEMVELGKIIDELETGVSVNSEGKSVYKSDICVLKTSAVTYGIFKPEENKKVVPNEMDRVKCNPKKDCILISRMNTEALVGASVYVDQDFKNLFLPDRLWQTIIKRKDVFVKFVQLIISSDDYRKKISEVCGGTSGSMKNISKKNFLGLAIPLPPLKNQHQIVTQIEKEQSLVSANKQLIAIYEQKIKDRIAKVWGTDKKESVIYEENNLITLAAEN